MNELWVGELAEWNQQGEGKVLWVKLSQCLFILHKSDMECVELNPVLYSERLTTTV